MSNTQAATPWLVLSRALKKHRFALFADRVGLLEETLFVDDALVKRPGVLRQSQRGVDPQQLGQVGRIVAGLGNRESGILGIDVDRREVE